MNPESHRITIERIIVETEGIEFAAAQRFGEQLSRALSSDLSATDAVHAIEQQKVAQAVNATTQRVAGETFI